MCYLYGMFTLPYISTPDIRIGTCAWSFDDWKGVFYAEGLPAQQRLAFYGRKFGSLEIDSTFYASPSKVTAGNWMAATPGNFVFTCKVPREITHVRKLRGCDELLAAFMASIEPLKAKVGCILIQLPSYFTIRHDEIALREFIHRLPVGYRWAIEFRDRGWNMPRIAHLLSEHRVCWVWNDASSLEAQNEAPFRFLPQTTDFLYVRFLGDLSTKYRDDGGRVHRYEKLQWPRSASLESWAVRIRQHYSEVERVFIFANNHFEGFAPVTCRRIAESLGTGEKASVQALDRGVKEAGQLEFAL